MSQPNVSRYLFSAALAVAGLSFLGGCGIGSPATGSPTALGAAVGSSMGGILHGGPNPVVGAQISLYTTSSTGYGAAATVVATTTTDSNGFFNLTLPTTGVACPAGQFAYVGAYSGTTGAFSNNTSSLLMAPVGLCDTSYSSTNSGGVYTNTYLGNSIWIDELTTAVSAYALGNFMTVTNTGAINIGAPTANIATVSAATPSTAGLAHAFANALAIVNNNSGQPYAYTHGGTSNATGGIIPDDEIFLLGNILQTCVNSNGVTGTNTSTANDGSGCGKLFSYVVPPQTSAAVPANTLQAMLDLAKYPNPAVNTWNSTCTAGGGSTTATTCLFNLAATTGGYANALTSAPPDWTLAIVYASGYGVQTASCASTCPGLVYPYFVALDDADNIFVLNYSGSTTTFTNIVGVGFDGTPIFATPQDTTDLTIATIGTDTASHVFGANTLASGSSVKVYSTASGATLATVTTSLGASSGPSLADPLNNIYVASTQSAINVRKLTYSGTSSAPAYAAASVTTSAPAAGVAQITYGTNLDLYFLTANSTSPVAYLLPNTATYSKGTAAAATYSATGLVSASLTGTTTNAYGIGGNSNGGAFAIDSVGVTPITRVAAAITAGTPTALPTVINSTLYSRGLAVDGLNTVFSPDGGNGSIVSGVSVYDSADNLALGTYKGCYVITRACGTTAGQVPMYSPRAAAIDSAGDVWVVSGASANLTELIGVAAPSWPALSLGLRGRPQ